MILKIGLADNCQQVGNHLHNTSTGEGDEE